MAYCIQIRVIVAEDTRRRDERPEYLVADPLYQVLCPIKRTESENRRADRIFAEIEKLERGLGQ